MEGILPLSTLQMLVSEAYTSLYERMNEAYSAAENRRAADEVLSDSRDLILRDCEDPKTMGANEAARTAYLNRMLMGERDNQRKAMEQEQEAVLALRKAEKRVEEARAYLTIARIAAALPERSH